MKISYKPTGVTNFHNSDAIRLVISGRKIYGSGDREVYHISRRQARRVEKHFCGISGCRCPAGGVEQLNQGGTAWGLPVRWCGEA